MESGFVERVYTNLQSFSQDLQYRKKNFLKDEINHLKPGQQGNHEISPGSAYCRSIGFVIRIKNIFYGKLDIKGGRNRIVYSVIYCTPRRIAMPGSF